MDPQTVVLNNLHYTSFRDHSLGQPASGIRDNVYSITPEQVKEFHNKYYIGENIVVSGAGDINPTEFRELVNDKFGSIRNKVEGLVDNS